MESPGNGAPEKSGSPYAHGCFCAEPCQNPESPRTEASPSASHRLLRASRGVGALGIRLSGPLPLSRLRRPLVGNLSAGKPRGAWESPTERLEWRPRQWGPENSGSPVRPWVFSRYLWAPPDRGCQSSGEPRQWGPGELRAPRTPMAFFAQNRAGKSLASRNPSRLSRPLAGCLLLLLGRGTEKPRNPSRLSLGTGDGEAWAM